MSSIAAKRLYYQYSPFRTRGRVPGYMMGYVGQLNLQQITNNALSISMPSASPNVFYSFCMLLLQILLQSPFRRRPAASTG